MTSYDVTMHECGGAARVTHRVQASSPEHAEFAAHTEMIPRTGLARRVAAITGTRWEVVSVDEVDAGPARTCTVRGSVTVGYRDCGRPAVYVEGEFAECAEHAAEHGSMASTRHTVGRTYGVPEVGDAVEVHRHGRTYTGTVVRVGARGAVYASVTYGNGVTREVRV